MKYYHGTDEIYLKHILKDGLQIVKGKNDSNGYISLTPNFGFTIYYSLKNLIKERKRSDPVIIKINLPSTYVLKLAKEGHIFGWHNNSHFKIKPENLEYETYELMFDIDILPRYISGYYIPKDRSSIDNTIKYMSEKFIENKEELKKKSLLIEKNWKFIKSRS